MNSLALLEERAQRRVYTPNTSPMLNTIFLSHDRIDPAKFFLRKGLGSASAKGERKRSRVELRGNVSRRDVGTQTRALSSGRASLCVAADSNREEDRNRKRDRGRKETAKARAMKESKNRDVGCRGWKGPLIPFCRTQGAPSDVRTYSLLSRGVD